MTDPARQRETLASLDRALDSITAAVSVPATFRAHPETTIPTRRYTR
ncbi:hypothetical protein ACFYMO_03755 [Streptomyces sp. NPDC007025]